MSKHLAVTVVGCLFPISAQAFDATLYGGTYSANPTSFQLISDSELIYCYHKAKPSASKNQGCRVWTYGASDKGYYVKFNPNVSDEDSAHLILDRSQDGFKITFKPAKSNEWEWSTANLTTLSRSIHKSRRVFEGNWSTGETATVKFLSSKKLAYRYHNDPEHKHPYKMIGNVAIISFANGGKLHLAPIAGRINHLAGTFRHSDGRQFTSLLAAEPYTFASNKRDQAKCVQAYLNASGYSVGRVDGAIGPGSQAAAQSYLDQTNATLPPLTKSNVSEWCSHFEANDNFKNVDISSFLD